MDKKDLLTHLKHRMLEDKTLPLCEGATQLVFADGTPETDLMLIGEGPGYWEDVKGLPFVGNAGAFLNELLAIAGFEREDVFITNVVHHRPPQNRDPELTEIAAYQPYLDEMINIIEPKLIITLGRFSMGKFLPDAKITQVHGKKFTVSWKENNIIVVPMYHPAAGLRNPIVKQQTIDDFKKLTGILEEIEKDLEVNEDKGEQMSLV